MNLPLQSVLSAKATKLFSGLHRVVGYVGNDVALLIRMQSGSHAHTKGPFAVRILDLVRDIEKGAVSVEPEPQARGRPASVADLKGNRLAKYELARSLIEEIEQENEPDESWLMPDRLNMLIGMAARKLQMKRLTAARRVYGWLASARSELALADRRQTGFRSRSLQRQGAKRGRPYKKGHFAITVETYSLPNSPDVRAKLRAGAEEFYDPYAKNFAESYDLTLQKHFSKKLKNGTVVLNDQLPSDRMYRQEIERLNDGEKALLRQKIGSREFGRNHRGLAGKERNIPAGPTFVFQADATFPTLDLVSDFDPSIVLGPATVYLVVDAWDGVIVGDYATYLPDSLAVASTALFYTFSDKYEEMKQAGISLKKGEYELNHACQRLYSDRGALRSAEGDQFARGLGLRMVTLLAERADMKGTIEQCHRLLDKELALAKGFRGKRRHANGRPSVTLPELRKALKRVVRKLNLRAAVEVPIGVKLPKNGKFTRLDHHAWGLKNVRGAGRKWPAKDLFLKLLPQEVCTYSREGVSFANMTFSSTELVKSGITAINSKNTQRPARVAFDKADYSRIWFVHPLAEEPIECENTDARIRKARANLEDALYLLERDKHSATATRAVTQQSRSALSADNHRMFTDAARISGAAQRAAAKKKAPVGGRKKARQDAEAADRALEAVKKAAAAGVNPPKVAQEARRAATRFDAAMAEKNRELAELLSNNT